MYCGTLKCAIRPRQNSRTSSSDAGSFSRFPASSMFRGMLFPFVKQLGRPKLAWIGVSFLFALIHADKAIFIPLFALALALTWLYEKTDNLLAPITAHALFNAANLIFLHYEQQINHLLEKLNHFLHMA